VKEQAAQIQKVSASLKRANLRHKWSTIPKIAPAPTKQQHFKNQVSFPRNRKPSSLRLFEIARLLVC
jgi:hypothetical protein